MDEAGRGPLAGPVVAACVILNPHVSIPGIRDSKKLTPQARERLYEKIMEKSLSAGVGLTSPARIDAINILEATKEAMNKAYRRLTRRPHLLLVDALHLSNIREPQRAILQGDEKSESIAAASIIAKVTRDRIMREHALQYPEYGFERHKGYPTTSHRKSLMHLGPCPIHRRSFKPVRHAALGLPSSLSSAKGQRCLPPR